jgi:hypothetical protein
MNAPAYQERAPRKKNILDDMKLRLSAEPVSGSRKRPSLSFPVIFNNPRIDVYTNVENDKNRGIISAKMDTPTFYQLMDLVISVANHDGEVKYTIDNFAPDKTPNEGGGYQKRDPIKQSTTVIGKDKEGVVYIAILDAEPDRPKIRFPFSLGIYHKLTRAGQGLTKGEESALAAKAWARLLADLTGHVLHSEYTPPPPRPEGGGYQKKPWSGGGGGGGGGGYQKKPWQGGGGGGGSRPPAVSDDDGFADDIPI